MRRAGLQRGFSLTEILVVMAIIVVLVGVLLPVLSRARKQGYATDDLSRLHQLGVAAALYHDQNNLWPRGVPDLIAQGQIQKEFPSFTLDPLPEGMANRVAAAREGIGFTKVALTVPYRNSAVGLREYRVNRDNVSRWIEPGTAGGWLLDFSPAKLGTDKDLLNSEGKYHRLCFDGAVVTRTFRDLDCNYKGTPAPCRMPEALFVDPDQEMLKWVRSL